MSVLVLAGLESVGIIWVTLLSHLNAQRWSDSATASRCLFFQSTTLPALVVRVLFSRLLFAFWLFAPATTTQRFPPKYPELRDDSAGIEGSHARSAIGSLRSSNSSSTLRGLCGNRWASGFFTGNQVKLLAHAWLNCPCGSRGCWLSGCNPTPHQGGQKCPG